jgi:hypothetical protein
MNQLVEFPLEGGGYVLVEAPDSDIVVTRGLREQGARVTQQAQESFERAVDRIRPAADALLSSLTALAHSPDEVSVEFAVQLSAEAGAVIANLGSTATFKVAIKWAGQNAR